MKSLLFDSGPIISLTMNNLLWLLEPLKKRFRGEFYITEDVRAELVERPLRIKKFEFEAVQVARVIGQGILSIASSPDVTELVRLANSCFKCRGTWLRIVQPAEVEILALAKQYQTAAVVDERTVRLLLEAPESLGGLLEKRLGCPAIMDENNVKQFRNELKDLHIIRSAELVATAFRLGLFDEWIPNMKKGREILIDAVLWGVRSSGCAITREEIDAIKAEVL